MVSAAADLHPTEANVLAHPADSADLPLVEDHLQEDLLLVDRRQAVELVAAAKIAAIDSKFAFKEIAKGFGL